MTRTATFPMLGERDKEFALRYVQGLPLPTDGKAKVEVIIRPVRRTKKQNKRYWSMINALVKSESTVIADRTWDSVGWHEIMLSLYLTEVRGEPPTIIEGAAGEFLAMGRSSKELDVEQFGDLMTSTLAFIDKHGIPWAEDDKGGDARSSPPPEAYE